MRLSRVWSKINPVVLRRRRRGDVVALGDSNTLIGYLPPWSRERWTAVVERETGYSVLNLGRDGATLRDAIVAGDLDRAVRTSPRVLLIGFAVNDSTRETPQQFRALLTSTVKQVRESKIEPVLMTGVWLEYPTRYSTNRRNEEIGPFNDVIRDVAAELDVRLADVAAAMQRASAAGNGDLRIRNGAVDASKDAGRTVESKWWNNVHLNAAGCRVVADEVVALLR